VDLGCRWSSLWIETVSWVVSWVSAMAGGSPPGGSPRGRAGIAMAGRPRQRSTLLRGRWVVVEAMAPGLPRGRLSPEESKSCLEFHGARVLLVHCIWELFASAFPCWLKNRVRLRSA